jgi:hypothetical protein
MATTISRSTANRAVHMKITPRPADLEQSREILKLVSRFGEVEYYRNLKYDTLTHPNVAIVIFKHEKDAWEFQKNAPIRFRMGRAGAKADKKEENRPERRTYEEALESRDPVRTQPGAVSGPLGMAHPRFMSTTARDLPRAPPRPPVMPLQPEPIDPKPLVDSRIFQIITSPARMHFQEQINVTQFHGSFGTNPKGSLQKALLNIVPLVGLLRIDWNAVEGSWTQLRAAREAARGEKTLMQIFEERSAATKPT